MKQFTKKLEEKLSIEIQSIEMEGSNILKKASKIIFLLESAFEQLRTFVFEYTFESEDEEILFFKEVKPRIFSQLIYYKEIYDIEMCHPNGSEYSRKDYILSHLDRLNRFFNKNIDFYQYYRSGKCCLDKYYFLRGRPDLQLNLDSFYFERDPKFSTCFDFKVSKILANELLRIYLNAELSKLEQPQNNEQEAAIHAGTKEKWTDSKIALVELIYAIHTVGSINLGKIDIKRLTSFFESIFNIELGDIYRSFLEIRGRKGNRTQYLDYLRDKLIDRMDDADKK